MDNNREDLVPETNGCETPDAENTADNIQEKAADTAVTEQAPESAALDEAEDDAVSERDAQTDTDESGENSDNLTEEETPEEETEEVGHVVFSDEEMEEQIVPPSDGEQNDGLTDAERAIRDYFMKQEPDEDMEEVAERITGARHSRASTAAPIKTRSPEQNRNVTNGIPTRKSSVTDTPQTSETVQHSKVSESEAKSEKEKKKKVPVTLITMMAVFAVLAIIITSLALSKNSHPDIILQEELMHDISSESVRSIPAPVDTEAAVPKQFSVSIDFFDRNDIDVSTTEITLSELLSDLGIVLYEGEVTSVPLESTINEDMVITVDRYTYETISVEEDIPFETEVIETDLIVRGTVNYLQNGETGVKKTDYLVEYKNGVENSRTETGTEITKYPVTERYEYGVGGTFVGGDGVTYTYYLRKVVPATYYNIPGLTYLGYEADESVIAVDMNVVPLGTKLYVKNAKYDFGLRTAADIGGGVKGDLIDIWIGADNPQLASFAFIGYHYDMEIYYVDQY